jgi:hypothetical protein
MWVVSQIFFCMISLVITVNCQGGGGGGGGGAFGNYTISYINFYCAIFYNSF